MLDGGDNDLITLTTVEDLANVVARAVEYDGEWPVDGGIKGTEISIGQLIALGEKVRGMLIILSHMHSPSHLSLETMLTAVE